MRPGTGPQLWCLGTGSAAIINIAVGVEVDDDEWTRPNTTVTPVKTYSRSIDFKTHNPNLGLSNSYSDLSTALFTHTVRRKKKKTL